MRHVEKMLQLKSAIPRTRCETHRKETCIMMNMKRRLLVMSFLLASAVPAFSQQINKMSTTTSTENTGLLAYLLPKFEAKTNSKVQVIAVGTGKALELAKNGDVDVTLVHARPAEDKFVAAVHGINRRDVMYNDFIIAGPVSVPAGVKGSRNVLQAMKQIENRKAKNKTHNDNSGTDQMEKAYWNSIGTQPQGSAYISAGLGMGEVQNKAAELQADTLTDRASYSDYRAKTGLAIAVEGDPKMFNPYGIIAVNPAKYNNINYKGAMQLIDWITSDEGQQVIASYKVDGQQLFFPSAI